MHDYQLERLNTRSFEQLIQALSIAVLGSDTIVYGDGPDGGRDVSFGPLFSYPNSKAPWLGKGVAQAKFKQIPSPRADANTRWIIKQIRDEFDKYSPINRGKRNKRIPGIRYCPDYYILATNIRLSSVHEHGGKDEVREILGNYKHSHGLKGFAIWDGDQICRFLDLHVGVRTSYAAWLLPSDVLTEMMSALNLKDTDFSSTIRRYLEAELLDDQYARLAQGGYTDAKSIPLSSVFIDLPVQLTQNGQKSQSMSSGGSIVSEVEDYDYPMRVSLKATCFVEALFEEGRQVLRPSSLSHGLKHFHNRALGRMVLVGGPGQGKTTLGQFACQILRAELLRQCTGPFSAEVNLALSRFSETAGNHPKVHVRRYPLRVDLKQLATSLASSGKDRCNSLLEYLTRRVALRTDSVVDVAIFRKWLSSYPWLLVLDGLDEVPTSSNREQVLKAIRDFVSVEAHRLDADLLILATTRPQGYSAEFDTAFYKHWTLTPLGPDIALTYGQLLASARHPGQRARIEELASALKRATENSATVKLMQSPLQVTIMLALIEGGGEPPEQRWKLFRDYYDVIYRREKERGTLYSKILGRYEPDIHWVHHRAGWILQHRNAEAGHTDARLSHSEFEAIVDDRLLRVGHTDTSKRLELVRIIREAAIDRLVLLVGNTDSEIGFEIRSLQEFMASEHLFDGGERVVQDLLHRIAPYPYWRNVFLFASGRVFFERQELIDTIITVCAEMNERSDDRAQNITLAGSRLALALLKDGAARNQPSSLRLLARAAARALDASDEAAIYDFADLFVGECEEVWKSELINRLDVIREKFSVHSWYLCFILASREREWALNKLQTTFPWAASEARTLAETFRLEPAADMLYWHGMSKVSGRHPVLFYIHQVRWNEVRSTFLKEIVQNIGVLSESSGDEYALIVLGHSNEYMLSAGVSLKKLAQVKLINYGLGEENRQWAWFRAVLRFATTPTLDCLVSELKQLSSEDVIADAEIEGFLPWQFAVCFRAVAAGMTWEEVLIGVEKGRIGSEDDWLHESLSAKSAISIKRLRCGKSELDVSSECLGNTFMGGGWKSRGQGGGTNSLVKVTNGIMATYPDISKVRSLIGICSYQLFSEAAEFGVEEMAVLTEFVRVCAKNRVEVPPILIDAVVVAPCSVDEKLDMLMLIDDCIIRDSWWADKERRLAAYHETLPNLVNAISGHHFAWRMLRPLSFLLPGPGLGGITPSDVGRLSDKGSQYNVVSARLKLNGLLLHGERFTLKHTDYIELIKNPDYLQSVFNYIETSGSHGVSAENFLVGLMDYRFMLHPSLVSYIYSLLLKLVQRRSVIAGLPDPGLRVQL